MTPASMAVRGAWGFGGWLVPLLITIGLMPLIVREAGAAQFGVLVLALATPALSGYLDLGLAAAATRDIAQFIDEPATVRRFARHYALRLTLVGVALSGAVTMAADGIAHALGVDDVLGAGAARGLVTLCASWLALAMVASLASSLTRAAQRMRTLMLVQAIGATITWGGGYALLASGATIEAVVWLGITVTVGATATYTLLARSLMTGRAGQHNVVAPSPWRFALTIYVGQLASLGVYQADRFVVAALVSPGALGLYALAVSLTSKVLAGAQAFSSFVLPHASGLFARSDRSGRDALYWTLHRSLLLFALPTIVPALALAPSFFSLWIGADPASEMVTAFRILWIGYAIATVSIPGALLLMAEGRAKLPTAFAWVTAGTALTLQVALVPSFGIGGAATAVTAGLAFSAGFDLVARVRLGIGAAAHSVSFRAGVGAGLATQLLLAMMLPVADGWAGWVTQGAILWSVFFPVRWVLRLAAPEEQRVAARLLRFVKHRS